MGLFGYVRERKLALAPARQTPRERAAVARCREEVARVVRGDDPRFLVVLGPCSAWPERAVRAFIGEVAKLRDRYGDRLLFAVRIYTQKPRTALGWKGVLIEPNPCAAPSIARGLRAAERMMRHAVRSGLAVADEALFLSAFSLIERWCSYAAIGARSGEDQEHRTYAACAPLPVGIKNTTSDNPETLVNALAAARAPAALYESGVWRTSAGNPFAHGILRGSARGGNYTPDRVRAYLSALSHAGVPERIIVDASHGNSGKRHERQRAVVRSVMRARERNARYRQAVFGVMLEAFLAPGRIDLSCDHSRPRDTHGRSITDACIGIGETREIVRELYAHVSTMHQRSSRRP